MSRGSPPPEPPQLSEQADDLARTPAPWRAALVWALVYGSIASAWIVWSDAWVMALASDAEQLAALQRHKGLGFVLVTTLLLLLAAWQVGRRSARQFSRLRDVAAALVEQDRRMQYLMSSLEEVVWFADRRGERVMHLSDSVERVYGRPVADFVKQPQLWFELVHPDDREMMAASGRTLRDVGSRTVTFRMHHADGSWRWVRDRALVMRDASGQVTGIGGISQDITEALESERRLEDSRAQLAGIIDSAMDAIITVDASQRICMFNRAASAMFRISAAEAMGTPLDRFIPPQVQKRHRELVDNFGRTGGSAREMAALHKLQGVRADGEHFPIEAAISRLGEGSSLLMTAVVRDATDLHAAQDARARQAEAEAANRAKSQFLSRMSHELRTPLNAVLGLSQLLMTPGSEPLSAQQRLRIDHIRQAGWHLLALINDVLDLSRIEAGHLSVERRSLDALEVIDEVLDMSRAEAAQRGVALQREPQPEAVPRILADRIRLRQVLLNLVSNAIKYNRWGGQVTVHGAVDAGWLRLEVVDDGIGMTPEQLAHLFEPFNRLGRERGQVEGTGIGLVLTRQLVALMQAELQIESEAGRGTRAVLRLPLSGADAELDETGPTGAHTSLPMPIDTPSAPDSSPQVIELAGVVLYVEDNPINMLVVEQLLARWPQLTLAQAEDGGRGIELARSLQPDLVLLDMRLPDMDGVDVLRALREDPGTSGLPVVALSASAMPDEVEQALQAGALEYWTKPLDFGRFLADMGRLLSDVPLAKPDAAVQRPSVPSG